MGTVDAMRADMATLRAQLAARAEEATALERRAHDLAARSVVIDNPQEHERTIFVRRDDVWTIPTTNGAFVLSDDSLNMDTSSFDALVVEVLMTQPAHDGTHIVTGQIQHPA
eukprot:Amastigsp_a345705_20.p1 type:complete len:112 gc:universal Amastigsp_a345705_20:494-159(-)